MTSPNSSGPDDFDPLDPRHWPAPPEPSERRWAEVSRAFAGVRPSRRPWWKVGAVAVGAMAAATVLIAWAVWPRTVPPTPAPEPVAERADDPLAEYDVLPVATASDVMVSAVRGGGVGFGSIDHPVPDAMPLASAGEVSVVHGPAAGELSCPEPGGMAMYVMPVGER